MPAPSQQQRGAMPPRANANQLHFPPFPSSHDPPQGHTPSAYQPPSHHVSHRSYGHTNHPQHAQQHQQHAQHPQHAQHTQHPQHPQHHQQQQHHQHNQQTHHPQHQQHQQHTQQTQHVPLDFNGYQAPPTPLQQMPQQYVYPPSMQRANDASLSQSPRVLPSTTFARSRQSVSTHAPSQPNTQTPPNPGYSESQRQAASNNTPAQNMHQGISDDTLAERLRESINSNLHPEGMRSNPPNETYPLPTSSSAPTAQHITGSPLLQPEGPTSHASQSRKRSADVQADSPATNVENSSPAPKRSKQDEKTIYTVVVADVEPQDTGEENRVQTIYCAGTYASKQAANGAAWSHLLQGFSKADFNSEHTMIDGCSRIEIKGLRPLQEEPRTPEMLAARAKSILIGQVTGITVPDVPLGPTIKADAVYIVTLMTDDGHFDANKREPNTEILGVYHNLAMAKWHAHATLNKFYGPGGRNAMSIDRKIVERKDTVLRFAIKEGPETKIIEVIRKKVGGPMSNTWYSSAPPPNIHGTLAFRQANAGSRS